MIYRLDLDDGEGTGGSGALFYTPGGSGVAAGWYGDVSLSVQKTRVAVPSKSCTVSYDADNMEYTDSLPDSVSNFSLPLR